MFGIFSLMISFNLSKNSSIKLVSYSDASEDGVHGLLDGLEISLESTDQAPRQVGISAVAS